MAAQQGGKSKSATKKRRQLQAPSEPSCRDITKTDKTGTPTGGVGKQSSRHRHLTAELESNRQRNQVAKPGHGPKPSKMETR
ncbi:hypothetical protein HPB50_029503 [Hyalomma asiaticum]|nr:hypothetical protein HPB50_029503 [Hyalomma asiaticum]